MNNPLVYFNDYYNRRASSGKLEICMSPSSSTITKSQSVDEIPEEILQRRRNESLGYLEFSKTANFRSRRDAVFEHEPMELRRMMMTVTAATTPDNENPQKRKATDNEEMMDVEGPKKLKHG